jgi:cell division protein FtsB
LIVPGLLLLFVLPLLGYAGYSVADRWYQGYQLSREEAALRTDILRLREENLKLQAELKDAKSDWAIETIAREQLGLVKPGDRAIVLVGPPPAAAQAKPAEVATRRAESPEAAAMRQRPTEAAPRLPEPAARQPEPAPQPSAPPESGGWRKVLDALLGR